MTAIKTIYQELDVKLFSNDSLMDKVSNDVEKSLDESKNLLFIDPILNIYSKFKRVPNLTNEELEFISKKYDEYLAVYKDAKESVKDRLSFPGCGETKNTVKDGDFIILHEIMKFMKENKTDAILLTRDVTKSDWLKRTRQPFVHYILKSYQLTGQILYIFDATDLLQIISFDNIYKKDTSDYEDLKHDNIQEFYKRRFLNIVISVKEQFKNKIEGLNSLTINEERNSLGENLDLIGYKVSGSSVGILVYQSGSTKKGFQKNVQKRINTCNRLIGRKIIDETILVIIIAKRQFLNRLDYDLLESKHPIKIVVFFCENLNEPDLELLDEIEI